MSKASFSPRALLGFVAIAAGAVLAIFFWDLRVQWFQGGPFGIALIGLGGLDFWESRRRDRGEAPRGLLQELRDDLVGPSQDAKPQPESNAPTPAEPEPAADEDVDGGDPLKRR